MNETHFCPECGTKSQLSIDFESGDFMIFDGEFVSLSSLDARLFCSCGWELTGTLSNADFDVNEGVLKAGEFTPDRR